MSSSPIDDNSRAAHWAGALAALALLVPLLGTVKLALERFVQADEFVFVRCAWLVADGAVPYRDFFDHHTPLFYFLLSPGVGLAPEDFRAVLVARCGALALVGILLFLVWRLGRRFGGTGGAWLATLLLATFPPFVARGIEIRPDLLAAVAFLGAGWLVARESRRPRVSALLAGALTAAAVLSTQKSVYYLWGFAVLWLVDVVRARLGRRGEALLRSPLAYATGVAAPLALFFLWLWWRGALAPFWEQNVALAIEWQSTERTFAATRYLREYLTRHPVWFLALAGGLLGLLRRRGLLRREGLHEASGRPDGLEPRFGAVYAALAVPAVLSLVVNPIPWPYNFIPVFAALAPLTAAIVNLRLPRGRFGPSLLPALVAVVALGLWSSWWAGELRRSNRQQRLDLGRVLEVTSPDQAVFDNNGGYLFRPAATWYWYHSSAMRELMNERFAETLADEIRASRAPAWILDFRFWDLPENVRYFLRWHYQRFDRALFLWGSAYRMEEGRSDAVFEFHAIDDGEYFVRIREGAVEGLDLRFDGDGVEAGVPFALSAGAHTLEITRVGEGPPLEFFVLWVPRTGELWEPLGGRPPNHYPFPF